MYSVNYIKRIAIMLKSSITIHIQKLLFC